MSGLIVLPNQEQKKEFGSRRAMLMQCVEGERKGLLGVHLQGGKFTCPLPKEYDVLTEVFYKNGQVFVTRPGQKMLICDFNKGTATPIA